MRGRMLAGAVGLGCAGLTVLTMLTFVPTAAAVPKAPAVPKVTVGPKAPAGQPCGAPDCGSGGRECGGPDCGSSGRACGTPDCGSRGQERPGYEGAAAGDEDVAADCRDAIENTAPGGSGGPKLTASVRDRATVAPGEDVTVRLTWNPKDWSGRDLDMALACVRVKGGLDSNMSGEERPSANDGVYEYRVHVPENIKPGCDICVQGFLAGVTAGGGSEQVASNEACFMSGPPARPTPPATQPPAAPPTPSPAVQAPPRTPAEVAGSNLARPASAPAPPAPAVAPAGELPRTGASTTRVGTTGGGLTLALGGLAVIGGAGRRSRRRTA